MANKQIVWSYLADKDFEKILDFLFKNWNHQVVLNFIYVVEQRLKFIAANPKMFPILEKKHGVRKCIITKHNTLFYQEDSHQIRVLRIYDSRQDPKKLIF